MVIEVLGVKIGLQWIQNPDFPGRFQGKMEVGELPVPG